MANSEVSTVNVSTGTQKELTNTEELFERAGNPSHEDKISKISTHLLAALVLDRALKHHYGPRQVDLYSRNSRRSSPEVRGFWKAATTMERAQLKVLAEMQKATELEKKQREKKRKQDHRRAVAAIECAAKVLARAATGVGIRCEDDRLIVKAGKREFAFRLVEAQ